MASSELGQLAANLLDVEHIREGFDLHVRETAVQLVPETRGPERAERVAQAVLEAGYVLPRVVGSRVATPGCARSGSGAPR